MIEHGHAHLLPNGFRYEVHKTVTATDLYLWARLTGERYAVHRVSALDQQTAARRHVVHGAYLTDLIVIAASHMAACLPPPGGSLAALTVHFTASVLVGTTLCVAVTVTDWDARAGLYWLDLRATRADGAPVVLGQAALRPHTTWLAAA
jgi:acyl dehydratase